jgi:hypothetical protein
MKPFGRMPNDVTDPECPLSEFNSVVSFGFHIFISPFNDPLTIKPLDKMAKAVTELE